MLYEWQKGPLGSDTLLSSSFPSSFDDEIERQTSVKISLSSRFAGLGRSPRLRSSREVKGWKNEEVDPGLGKEMSWVAARVRLNERCWCMAEAIVLRVRLLVLVTRTAPAQ